MTETTLTELPILLLDAVGLVAGLTQSGLGLSSNFRIIDSHRIATPYTMLAQAFYETDYSRRPIRN